MAVEDLASLFRAAGRELERSQLSAATAAWRATNTFVLELRGALYVLSTYGEESESLARSSRSLARRP